MLLHKLVKSLKCNVDLKRRLDKTDKKARRRRHHKHSSCIRTEWVNVLIRPCKGNMVCITPLVWQGQSRWSQVV